MILTRNVVLFAIVLTQCFCSIKSLWISNKEPKHKVVRREVINVIDKNSVTEKKFDLSEFLQQGDSSTIATTVDDKTPTDSLNLPGNNLHIGICSPTDQRIYTDDTIIENSGPSTLNGTLEIYIEAPVKITCINVEDQITDGTGAIPTYNSGGIGKNWVFIDVHGQYGKGFHFKIHIFGVPDYPKLKHLRVPQKLLILYRILIIFFIKIF